MSTAIWFLKYFHAVNADSAEHSQLSKIIYMFFQSLFLASIYFNYKIRLIFLSLFFLPWETNYPISYIILLFVVLFLGHFF